MRVVKAFGPGDMRLVTVPEPTPGPGEVLIAVKASGICGSDKWLWRVSGPVDDVAGHEVAGDVVALGPGVTSLKPGDRVAVNNVVGCGECPACTAGAFVDCPHRPGRDVNNGFGEFLAAPARNCLRLADELSYEAGCLIFDNWGTPYAALTRGGVEDGTVLAVSGCGPIGLAAVALAKERGAKVFAVDPVDYRQRAALRLGADTALAPDEKAAQTIKDLTGGIGVDTVVECSGQGAAYQLGLSILRIGGRLVAVGEEARVDLRPSEYLIHRRLGILGSWYTTMIQGGEVQEMMVRGRIDPKAVVSHRVSLDEVPAAFARVCACRDEVLKTVILL